MEVEYLFAISTTHNTATIQTYDRNLKITHPKKFLLTNPETPSEIIRLAYKQNPKTLKASVKNPNTPPDLLLEASQQYSTHSVLSDIVVHPNITDSILQPIVDNHNDDWALMFLILENPYTSDETTTYVSNIFQKTLETNSTTQFTNAFITHGVLTRIRFPTKLWLTTYFQATVDPDLDYLQETAVKKKQEFDIIELKKFYLTILEMEPETNLDSIPLKWLEQLVETVITPVQ